MKKPFRDNLDAVGDMSHVTLGRGAGWGLVGGLAGTLVMDLILMGVLLAVGLPPLSCFSIVGETMAAIFSLQVSESTKLIPLGIAAHYLIGPAVGVIFGIGVARINALRRCSMKKRIILAVLYVEVLSQPILATAPILLGWNGNMILIWYCGSFIMHFILGLTLGAIVSVGFRQTGDIEESGDSPGTRITSPSGDHETTSR